MDIKEQNEIFKKIENIKDLQNINEIENIESAINKSEVERLYEINDNLLEIIEKELEKKEVPSKEVLDTIQTSLIITATLPWSKYNI